MNLHSGNTGCSVACLEWQWWTGEFWQIARPATKDTILYNETIAAKEAKSLCAMLRKTPRLFPSIGD